MAGLNLCTDDELIKALRELFKATPVRVPESRIRPLSIVARKNGKAVFLGDINGLLKSGSSLSASLQNSTMANLSAKRTKKVDASFGITVLEGFLQGFSVPSAGVETFFNGAKKVSFSFNNVVRSYIDIITLGGLLNGVKLELSNPSLSIFKEESPWEMLLIDSVITSNNFSINVEESNGIDFNANIKQINQVLSGNAKVSVSTTNGYDLSFNGDENLSFAFSVIQLFFNPKEETISSINPAKQVSQLESLSTPEAVFFDEKEILLEWNY